MEQIIKKNQEDCTNLLNEDSFKKSWKSPVITKWDVDNELNLNPGGGIDAFGSRS